MTHKNYLLLIALSAALLSTTACDSLKDKLGLTRHTPDEFAVITRAPLQVPSNLNELTTLPQPQKGTAHVYGADPVIEAKQAIGIPTQTNATPSTAEENLLSKVGKADANIRTTVDQEAANIAENKRPVIKRIMGSDNEAPATILNPTKEKERLINKSNAPTPSKSD